MKFFSLTLTMVMGLAPLSSTAQEVQEGTATITEDIAPPPPLPRLTETQEESARSVPQTTYAAEKVGEQKSLLLRDGTRVQGTVLRADAEFVILKTALGELAVPRSSIQPMFLRLKFLDGDVIVGELLAEDEGSFLIDGVFGQMKVRRDQLIGFERAYFKNQLARIPGASTGSPDGFAQRRKNDGAQRFSHSNIEPLIDIFFEPTGYTFQQGDIYISGLSFGYGFTDNFHATVNVLELVGLNSNGMPNLRATTKWNFFKRKNAKREWLMSAVLAGDAFTRLGNQQRIKSNTEFTRSATDSDEDATPEDREWTVSKEGTLSVTGNRNTNFFGDESNDDSQDGEFYITDIDQADDDGWSCYTDTEPAEALRVTGNCSSSNNDSMGGPRAELYFANTYSWLLQRGGRFGWHNGVKLSMDALNYNNWTADPTYRVYSAFDLDLNHKFKLLGEIFYDPNYKAIFTDVEDIGLDFGMMYAFTPDFRVLIHLEGPFLGLFWRF
jgi:hypothetical protein